MKEIILMSAHMENFKRFKEITIEFDKNTSIYAENFKGKSSVADAFSWVLFNKSATGNSEGSQFRPRRYDENGVNIDYVDVVDFDTITPVETLTGSVLVAIAVYIGKTRLIDNFMMEVEK